MAFIEPPGSSPAAVAPTPTGTESSPATYPVATATRTFDDVARQRKLPVTLYFPAGSSTSNRDLGDPVTEATAPASPALGAFPLVLVAHGYRLPGDGYDRVMRTVAAYGYVVAAPEFPHTTSHGGDGLRADITNQPADLSFVADQVITLGSTGTTVPAIQHPEQIAVVGHSDGGLTATAFGYGHQFRDHRVAAVVSLTGGVALFPGTFYASDSPALLAAHARDDSTNPYSASVNLFNGVPAGRPRFLLSIDTGGHIDPYMFATGRVDLGDAIAAFMDLTLQGYPDAANRLREAGTRPGFSLEEG